MALFEQSVGPFFYTIALTGAISLAYFSKNSGILVWTLARMQYDQSNKKKKQLSGVLTVAKERWEVITRGFVLWSFRRDADADAGLSPRE